MAYARIYAKRLWRRRIRCRIVDVCAIQMFVKRKHTQREKIYVCTDPGTQSPLNIQIPRHSLMRLCVWPWVVFRCFHWISSPLRRFHVLLFCVFHFFAAAAAAAKVQILCASLSLFCSNASSIYLKTLFLRLKKEEITKKQVHIHTKDSISKRITAKHEKKRLHSRNPFFLTNKTSFFLEHSSADNLVVCVCVYARASNEERTNKKIRPFLDHSLHDFVPWKNFKWNHSEHLKFVTNWFRNVPTKRKEPSRKRAEVLWANTKCNRNVKACEIQEREKKEANGQFHKTKEAKVECTPCKQWKKLRQTRIWARGKFHLIVN